MAWIGMLGSKAVAGVGVGGMYVWLSQGLSSLARMGAQVNVAQSFGRGRKDEAREYARAALKLTLVFGVLFALISVVFTEGLVSLFHLGDEETVRYAEEYMRLTCGMVIFSYMTVVLTGIYTAQGDSKTPLLANFIGLIINIIMDPLLILGIGPFPRMEVIGAAVATVSAQFIVMMVMIAGVWKAPGNENILVGIRLFSPSERRYYKGIFRIGLPTAIQGTVYCGISMILTRMVAVFGPGAVAVQRVGGQVEAVSWNTADGFAAALNAFAAQNYGAGNTKRIQKGLKGAVLVSFLFCIIISSAIWIFARPLMELFVNKNETRIIMEGIRYLHIEGAFYWGIGCLFLLYGLYRAIAVPAMSVVLTIISLGTRVLLAYLLSSVPSIGVAGIWWAIPIGWILADTVGVLYYRKLAWSTLT